MAAVARLASRDKSVARTLVWQASTAFSQRVAIAEGQVGLGMARGVHVRNVGPAPIAAAHTACYPPPPTSSQPPMLGRGALAAVQVHRAALLAQKVVHAVRNGARPVSNEARDGEQLGAPEYA